VRTSQRLSREKIARSPPTKSGATSRRSGKPRRILLWLSWWKLVRRCEIEPGYRCRLLQSTKRDTGRSQDRIPVDFQNPTDQDFAVLLCHEAAKGGPRARPLYRELPGLGVFLSISSRCARYGGSDLAPGGRLGGVCGPLGARHDHDNRKSTGWLM
jgi:hypothetical protein